MADGAGAPLTRDWAAGCAAGAGAVRPAPPFVYVLLTV